ncbi:Uncharacterised protein [Actinobacillus indolicus]|nr:Uncharacterised protein [Actinobacillus indolicus]VTU09548.1 Uncharacterised protein [Actinobacillus indolicus]
MAVTPIDSTFKIQESNSKEFIHVTAQYSCY